MNSQSLQELALKVAKERFDERVQRLVEAADGDAEALTIAARKLAKKARTAGSPEHIAFTYLSAAYRRINLMDDD